MCFFLSSKLISQPSNTHTNIQRDMFRTLYAELCKRSGEDGEAACRVVMAQAAGDAPADVPRTPGEMGILLGVVSLEGHIIVTFMY